MLPIGYCCFAVLQVTQLQSQLARKDADIASLADKLEAAVEAAANATRAAAQQQPAASAAVRGVADEEARKAVALAQSQVGLCACRNLQGQQRPPLCTVHCTVPELISPSGWLLLLLCVMLKS
jgi:hypothetical protein